jgi:hypothetical protein
MGCACAALDKIEEASTNKQYLGTVYYHQQDRERFERTGILDIRYFSLACDPLDIVDQIKYECEEIGLTFSWSGNTEETIKVS